jgi:hypothetical protein
MKFFQGMVLTALLGLPAACAARAQTPAAAQGFEAYRAVRTRNIFDPERYPSSMEVTARTHVATAAAPPKASDFIALTGIMVTDNKAFAFFSGSRADYDKVVAVNGEIAGAKVTKIATDKIEVERQGKKIDVGVGQTVPFDGSAPAAAPANPVLSAAPAPSSGGGDSPASGAPPGNLSEVMRRMMERRQQQLK